ncbi:phosphatase PAP2 family protein [Candidatus Peregrinibacteria bacterium]|nr:phosphatase PAP2 family protein [Candidatus Peregrinibacteria bacterium]
MKKFFLLFIFVTVLIASFSFDAIIVRWMADMRRSALDPFILWFTDAGPVMAVVILMGFIFLKILDKKEALLEAVLIMISFAAALEGSFLLKEIFNIPRPAELFGISALTQASYSSFPSMHSAFAFSALPFLKNNLKNWKFPWLLFAILIAGSRVYIGVHFVSDVVGGALVGLLLGYGISMIEEKWHFAKKALHHLHDKFELRRQIAHSITGISIIILVQLGYLTTQGLAIILAFGALFIILAKNYRIPFLHDVLLYFERPHHFEKFPGRGSFFLIFGSLAALLLFPKIIAFAGIAIMAIGDSVTNIFGRYFGKIKNPLNPKKNIEGTAIAIIAGTLAANFFVPIVPAFIASLVAMVIESIDLKIGRFDIDDNVVIPLVAGLVIVALSS